MAEEVGVEPTSHFNSSSTALKAAHTTGCNALPLTIVSKKSVADQVLFNAAFFQFFRHPYSVRFQGWSAFIIAELASGIGAHLVAVQGDPFFRDDFNNDP